MTMKQNLLKTIALGLMAMVGVNAWADNTVTVKVGEASTGYATLKAAIEADAFKNPTGDIEVSISADQSLGDKVISWEPTANTNYTLTIKATKDITIKGPNGSRWFTVKNNGANLVVGDGNYEITLDGEYSGGTTKQRTNPVALRNNTTANITFNKVTFANFNLNNAVNMIVAENGGGSLTLQDVAINNCVNPKNGYIDNLRVENDKVLLKGYLNIDEASAGTAFYLALETKSSGTNGRVKIMDDSFTASKPLSIEYHEISTSYTPKIGASLVVKDGSLNNFTVEQANMFTLTDSEKGLVKSNKDLKLTQAYTLAVANVGAATLVLPFEATIPANASVYKLAYTEGEPSVNTTEVSTTLAANTPVLVMADEGSYKFVSTATSGETATGSDPVTVGALTGVYAETIVPSTAYTLNTGSHGVGFYKSNGSKKVKANRAYLSVGSLSAPAYFDIDFNNGTTGIRIVSSEANTQVNDGIYNLQGVRVENPQKGIYIKNGKKYVVK